MGKSRRKSGIKTFFRRVLLYGTMTAAVIAGTKLYRHLEASAEEADLPFETITSLEGNFKEPLFNVLTKSGSSPEEASAVSMALKRGVPVRSLGPGDSYRIVRSTSGEFLHMTLVRGLLRHVVSRQDGKWKASSQKIHLSTHQFRRSGTIKGSLWASMNSQGISDAVVMEFAGIFQWTIDFLSEPREGDRYAVVWRERRSPDGRVWARTIESATYEGRATGKKTAVLFRDRYYDEKGDSLERMFLRAPLEFARISSYFNKRRYHPVLRRYRPHHGIDYAAPRGTPVVSIGEGRVVHAGWKGGFGRMVEIRHNSKYTTIYGHLQRIGRGVRRGAKVRQAQVIGLVGSTGLATGPHLHFEIRVRGRQVNFLALKLPFAHSVSRARLGQFKQVRDLQVAALQNLVAEIPSNRTVSKN